MPKLHGAGKCGSCCGPCCATVWGYLRDEYSSFTWTMNGNDAALLSPSPYVVTGAFIESFVSGGITFYQCLTGGEGREIAVANADYYAPADPRRMPVTSSLDPGTGITSYIYSIGSASISATVCEPTPAIRIQVVIRYKVRYASSPSAAISAAGFVPGPGSTWELIDGDITHTITNSGSDWLIESVYDKTVTGAANLMSGFPSTITVTPAWNPFGMSSELVLS